MQSIFLFHHKTKESRKTKCRGGKKNMDKTAIEIV